MNSTTNHRFDSPRCCLLFVCLCLVILPSACSKERDNPWDPHGINPSTWKTILAGTFQMGSPTSPTPEPCRNSDETPHQVTLSNKFEMQTTEVTQGQFNSLMGYKPAFFSPGGGGAKCGLNCPVEQVNWHEAVAYCSALSAKAKLNACYTCTGSGTSVKCQEAAAYSGQKVYACPGYRLPTEAEWEYAYRAGTSTAFYNGTNNGSACTSCSTKDPNADSIGWYCYNSKNTTHPVGQKTPNAWGLYDMAGNVWEWCHDWGLSSYGSSAMTDPWGSASGSYRVLRGGSWYYFPYSVRAAGRYSYSPTLRSYAFGFRCARTKN